MCKLENCDKITLKVTVRVYRSVLGQVCVCSSHGTMIVSGAKIWIVWLFSIMSLVWIYSILACMYTAVNRTAIPHLIVS